MLYTTVATVVLQLGTTCFRSRRGETKGIILDFFFNSMLNDDTTEKCKTTTERVLKKSA